MKERLATVRLPSVLTDLISRIPLSDKLPGKPGEKVLLELDLGRGLAEAAPSNPIEAIRALRTPLLRTLVEHLRKAARDDSVVGLIGIIPGDRTTMAQSDELRAAVHEFGTSGKPTLAFSPTFGELLGGTVGYHLASAFDEIWLQPASGLGLVGFSAQATFLRGTLDKLGVQPEFGQRHEYKSAADLFTRSTLSEPHREMLSRLVESATEQFVADVATDRGLDADVVRQALADAPLTPEDAVERGLIDHVGYRDEAYTAMRERVVVTEPTLRYVERHGVSRFDAVLQQLPKPSTKPRIALIEAIGPIDVGHAGPGPGGPRIGSDSLGAALRAAAKDDHVTGVVLRIDSPGGSAVASDSIRRDVQQVRAAGKPVVASMASVAASGGYYIAMPCERIVAAPGTITGSIGVLAGKFVIRDALGKIGINRELIAGAPRATMFSAQTPFDEEEWAILDAWLDRIYADFTAKAAADRGMPLEDLQAVAKGRVWTGADALERGLVDRLGGLDAAIAETCALLGVDRRDVHVAPFPKPHPLAAFQPPESSESVQAAVAPWPAEGPRIWQTLMAGLQEVAGWHTPGVLSLPPVHLPGLLPGGRPSGG
ncbi:MAG TPA: signal peptide peptidase SppA [Intrasporangiaceae bacterium]|nr:signal peptide peptidase SppA [Intrasporangiaceae bacterium]